MLFSVQNGEHVVCQAGGEPEPTLAPAAGDSRVSEPALAPAAEDSRVSEPAAQSSGATDNTLTGSDTANQGKPAGHATRICMNVWWPNTTKPAHAKCQRSPLKTQ